MRCNFLIDNIHVLRSCPFDELNELVKSTTLDRQVCCHQWDAIFWSTTSRFRIMSIQWIDRIDRSDRLYIQLIANEMQFSDQQWIESSLFRWNLLNSIGHECLMVDKSEYGWKTVGKYLDNKLPITTRTPRKWKRREKKLRENLPKHAPPMLWRLAPGHLSVQEQWEAQQFHHYKACTLSHQEITHPVFPHLWVAQEISVHLHTYIRLIHKWRMRGLDPRRVHQNEA